MTNINTLALDDEVSLIQKLYASITHPQGFHPFLAELAISVKAFSGNLCSVDRRTRQLGHVWYSSDNEEQVNLYMDRYISENLIEHDVVLNLAVSQNPGDCQTGLSALDTLKQQGDPDRWERSYQRFIQALGVMDTIWMVVHADEDTVFVLTLNRTPGQGEYTEQELQMVRRLLPYLRQSYQLHREVSTAQLELKSMSAVLDALSRPLIILNAIAEVIHCNSTALTVLEDCSELSLEGKRFRLLDLSLDNEMKRNILSAIRSSMGVIPFYSSTQFIPRQGKPDVILSISPIDDLDQGGGVLVTLLDPALRELPDAKKIGHYFSLTKAESRLCEELITGISLKEVAVKNHKSEATLRSYLKAIYQKTGYNRQGQLISGILGALNN